MSNFPISLNQPPEHDGVLPAEADVVVIGAGIAGVSAAWELAGQGLKVVLCEKGRVGGEQSSRNWGWIRAQGRDPAELPMVLRARRLWEDWAKRLGPGLGYRQCGVSYLSNSESELADFEGWLEHARAHDLDSKLLSPTEIAKTLPGMADQHWRGALHTASDACAEPFAAVPLMARALADAGVIIRENCAVRRLYVAGGQVRGVVTETGAVSCDAVVLTGGAWSSLFLRAHGVSIPQMTVRASVAATGPVSGGPDGAAVDDKLAFRKRADGGYTLAAPGALTAFLGPDAFRHFKVFLPHIRDIWKTTRLKPFAPRGYPDGWRTKRRWAAENTSPFEAQRILDPAPDMFALNGAREAFEAAFPGLSGVEFTQSWAGMIDTMPDVVPVVDQVPQLPGLVVGTGLSGHGFGIGPAIGQALADLVMQNTPKDDLSRFRISRFSDGSKLAPGPTI